MFRWILKDSCGKVPYRTTNRTHHKAVKPVTLPKLSYTRREAAQVASVGVDTIDKAIGSGALPARKTSISAVTGEPAGKILILAADLHAWLEGLPAA